MKLLIDMNLSQVACAGAVRVRRDLRRQKRLPRLAGRSQAILQVMPQ